MRIIKMITIASLITASSIALAANPSFKPSTQQPAFKASQLPTPPSCAPGFTVVNAQLLTTGGNDKFYVYDCVKQETIIYKCNPNTTPTNMEAKIQNQPGPEVTSRKATSSISYSCYKPIG